MLQAVRIHDSEHTSRPWRIHEIAGDFDLEDVWALPTPGGPNDFPRLVELIASLDPGESSSALVRALFAIRWRVGRLLGWEAARGGCDESPLPFSPLYATDDEWAAEVDNPAVHGIIHLAWVEDGSGGHRGQMAVLVKRKGRLGAAYMAAITPFRYLVVYPQLLRDVARAWAQAST